MPFPPRTDRFLAWITAACQEANDSFSRCSVSERVNTRSSPRTGRFRPTAVSVSVFDGFRFLSADASGRARTRANCGGSACCCYPLRLRPEIVLSRYLVGGNLGGNGGP